MADATKAPSTAELWPLIHEQRKRLAEVAAAFTDAEWEAPSLCTGWRVRDVLAHCVETNLMTPGRFVGRYIGTGFRFHAMNARGLARHAQQSPEELLTQYRETMTRTTAPPGPKVAMLAEAVIHGEDLARPSGKRVGAAPATAVVVANFCRASTPLLHGKERSAGLKLRATDADWTAGDGPEVNGPLVSIILGITGRKSAIDDLAGDGVATLRSRP